MDVQLIADLHKSEVFTIGKALDVPQATLVAAPSADLWDGQTDEDELGFTYVEELNFVITFSVAIHIHTNK